MEILVDRSFFVYSFREGASPNKNCNGTQKHAPLEQVLSLAFCTEIFQKF